MTEEEKKAIEELRDLQKAFGFNRLKDTQEYYYLRDEEPKSIPIFIPFTFVTSNVDFYIIIFS